MAAVTDPPTHAPPRRWRFTLQGMFLAVAVVGATMALVVQHRRLTSAEAALARYESTRVPTTLADKQFRVIAQTVLDTKHAKVMKYRIESNDRHFASVGNGQGDSNGCSSQFDPSAGFHITEVVMFIDHVVSENRVKMMPKVGGAQGYSVAHVADNFVLGEHLTFHDADGAHPRGAAVPLLKWNGKTYSLSLK